MQPLPLFFVSKVNKQIQITKERKKTFCKENGNVFFCLSPFFNVDDVYFVSDIHSLISTMYRHSYEYYKLIVIDKFSCTSRTYNLYNNIKNKHKGKTST